jgi:hypothetical protein
VLIDAGATKDQAKCTSAKIDDKLDQGQLNDLAKADTAKDIPDSIEEIITPILDECLSEGGGSTDETTSTTAEGDSSSTESTTTTTG